MHGLWSVVVPCRLPTASPPVSVSLDGSTKPLHGKKMFVLGLVCCCACQQPICVQCMAWPHPVQLLADGSAAVPASCPNAICMATCPWRIKWTLHGCRHWGLGCWCCCLCTAGHQLCAAQYYAFATEGGGCGRKSGTCAAGSPGCGVRRRLHSCNTCQEAEPANDAA